ncbi:MAG: transglutaminase-like cysteine peptidase [Dongiaceae bacterium]
MTDRRSIRSTPWRRLLRSRRAGLLAAGVALLAAGLAGPAAATQDYPELFGTTEVPSSDLKLFPKWRGAVDRFRGEQGGCAAGQCDSEGWRAFIEEMRGKDPRRQLADINRRLNENPYIIDPINWGVPDYWATPFQFLRRDGDCEDYAIAKFMALRALGVPNERLRIVVLQDINLQIAHAILVVYLDGEAFVLDNQIASVVPASSIRHYRPVYSINEAGWWLHRT